MNKRIRYSKNADGSFTSMQVLKGPVGLEYRVTLNADGKSGSVTNISSGAVDAVTGTSAHKTKIAIKRVLLGLGVVFEPEGRKKRSDGVT